MGNAFPNTMPHTCHISEAFPYFKGTIDAKALSMNANNREELKNELILLTELSRFLNKKAPLLLQEFAESKKIYQTKKKLGMIEFETELRKKMYQQSRQARSVEKDIKDDSSRDDVIVSICKKQINEDTSKMFPHDSCQMMI